VYTHTHTLLWNENNIIVVNIRGNGTKTNRGRIYNNNNNNNNHKRKNINNNNNDTLHGRRIKMFSPGSKTLYLTPGRTHRRRVGHRIIYYCGSNGEQNEKKLIISPCGPCTRHRRAILCSNCQTTPTRRGRKFACRMLLWLILHRFRRLNTTSCWIEFVPFDIIRF